MTSTMIEIELGNGDIYAFNTEDARKVYEELHKLFGDIKETDMSPWIQPWAVPSYPPQPFSPYPWVPYQPDIIWCNSGTSCEEQCEY